MSQAPQAQPALAMSQAPQAQALRPYRPVVLLLYEQVSSVWSSWLL
jgi:hypothetical protein